jgi:predicted enzyme related to lactoylglutathione lyase
MHVSGRSLIFAWLVTVAAAAPGTVLSAQTPILPILDHIHLNVPDQARAVEWYQKSFGGKTLLEAPDRLMLGETRLIFLKNDKGSQAPRRARHLGFSVADLDAKMKELEAAGAKVVTPARDVPGSSSWHLSKTRGGRGSKSSRIRRSSACTTCTSARRTRQWRSPGTRRSSAAIRRN